MYRSCQVTWSDLRRGKEEEETRQPNWWACTPRRMMLFQKHLWQLQHKEGFSYGNSPKTYVSAARESKTIQNPCILCKDPDGCPSGQGKSGTDQDNCKRCFSLLVLQREREEVCSTQHLHGAYVGLWGDIVQILRKESLCHSWINWAYCHREFTAEFL